MTTKNATSVNKIEVTQKESNDTEVLSSNVSSYRQDLYDKLSTKEVEIKINLSQ